MRKSYFIKTVFWLLLFTLPFFWSYSQDVRDKFTSGSVFNLKKDSLGRIWMATDNGLFVSDGNNYIQMVIGDQNITNSSIKDLVLYRDKLYLIYANKGLFQFDINTLVYNKISDNSVSNIIVQDSQTIFMLNKDGDLYNIKAQKEKGFKLKLITHLGNDRDNAPIMTDLNKNSLLVAFTNKGIFRINKTNGKLEKEYNLKPDGFNNKFIQFGRKLFFINKGQLYELNNKEQFVLSSYVNKLEYISNLIPISSNQKIVITHKKNIYQINDTNLVRIVTSKLKNYEIYDALFINNDYVIYGTNQGVIKVLNVVNKIFNIHDSVIQKDQYINVRRKIIPYKHNKIIFLGFPIPHLYDLDTKKFTPLTTSINSTFDGIVIGSSIFATSEGGGVKKINIDNKTIINIQTKDIDTIRYYGAIQDVGHIVSNSLLLGRRGELILYNYKTNSSKSISLNNLNAKVNSIKVDSLSNLVYVATDDGIYAVSILNKSVIKKINIPGSSFNDILILRKKGRSLLWSISNLGLLQIDLSNNKILTNAKLSNFNNSKLTAIISDHQNRIWISTYGGVYSYEYEKNNLISIREKNGLINQEFNYKSASILPNGKIIFGGLNGYDVIDPDAYNFSDLNLKGTILGYSIYSPQGHKYYHYKNDDIIQYNTSDYYIEFYFSMKEKEKFRMSEFEFQIDNKDVTKILNLSFFYTYTLKDGIHNVDLRGWDENGHLIKFPQIKINHYTNFFNSVNFKYFLFFIIILILLVTIFVIYFSYKNVIQLRTNIAMDLHDEIGSIINRSLFIVKSDKSLSNNNHLVDYLSEAMYGIRTYIKAFNSETISLHNFLSEVKDFNQTHAKGLEIKFILSYNFDKEYFINSNLYKDLKLIMYEIHHNIIKHSKASIVTTEIIAKSNKIEITVSDDGVLTNVELIEHKGNGISNIRKRVERSRGKVVFSIPSGGNGLQINGIFYI